LESKALKENGGSGAVGKYKVYQNGDYELAIKFFIKFVGLFV